MFTEVVRMKTQSVRNQLVFVGKHFALLQTLPVPEQTQSAFLRRVIWEGMLMSPDNQWAAGADNPSPVTAGDGLVQACTDNVLCAFESASEWLWRCLPALGAVAVRAAGLGDAGGVHQL